MHDPRKLLTFEFLGLSVVIFLAFCNVTVFYNLFNYLETLQIPADLRGLVIGSYSLTAMLLYLLVSPFLSAANAVRTMLLGIAVAILCGVSYLFVYSFWGLLLLRIMNGFGQFLMSAGAMTLFVSVIPKERSGQAFAIYSVAILLPFAAVPAVMDTIVSFIPTPPHGYAGATVTLLPAAWIVLHIRRRRLEQSDMAGGGNFPSWADIRVNVKQPPVALLLLLTTVYIINWSSMFFLMKGFADQKGITNVGAFFAVQTGLMIAFRLLGGRLFDAFDKARIVLATFIVIAIGHLALDNLPGAWAISLVAVIFGVGMGMGQPTFHALMFEVSPPRFRPLNANMILFSTQAGFFLGPIFGGALIARWGYHGYFLFSVGLALVAASASMLLPGKRQKYSA
jgi:MFS family permease